MLVALALVVAGCAAGGGATVDSDPAPTEASDPSPTETIRNIVDLGEFEPLEPGTYFIDPDNDRSTPVRVMYTVAAEGWASWIGAAKLAPDGLIGVSITSVTNLVRDGCRDHRPAEPPVGPAVDDLASALAVLAPFEVTSPPTDVSIYGYRGKHVALTVPDLPVERHGDDIRFTACSGGRLTSWMAPRLSSGFYGYTGPGHNEEFWILDIDESRLVIQATWSPGSPAEDIADMRAILDSIRIER